MADMTVSRYLQTFKGILLIVTLLLPALTISAANTRDEALKHYDAAQQLMLKGDSYNAAMREYLEFMLLSERDSVKLIHQREVALINIANIYFYYHNPSKALELAGQSYSLSRLSGNQDHQWSALNNMALYNIALGNLKTAEECRQQIRNLNTSVKGKNIYGYISLGCNIANAQCDDKAFRKACDSTLRIIEHYKLDNVYKSYIYKQLSEYYIDRNRLDSALHYQQLYHEYIRGSGRTYLVAESLRKLMEIYTATNMTDSALYYQKAYFRLNDSLLNVREFSSIVDVYEQYEKNRKDARIRDMAFTISRQKAIIWSIIIIILLTGAAFLWRHFTRRRILQLYGILFHKDRQLLTSESPSSETHTDVQLNADKELYDSICKYLSDVSVLSNPDLSAAQLSAAVGATQNRVAKVVREIGGRNVRSLINEYRIREVCRRILDNDKYGHLTITAISESLGYRSQAHFNRTFKAITGMTPSMYQKLSRTESHQEQD